MVFRVDLLCMECCVPSWLIVEMLGDSGWQGCASQQRWSHWTNSGLRLGRRRRRWPNLKPALVRCIVSTGMDAVGGGGVLVAAGWVVIHHRQSSGGLAVLLHPGLICRHLAAGSVNMAGLVIHPSAPHHQSLSLLSITARHRTPARTPHTPPCWPPATSQPRPGCPGVRPLPPGQLLGRRPSVRLVVCEVAGWLGCGWLADSLHCQYCPCKIKRQ